MPVNNPLQFNNINQVSWRGRSSPQATPDLLCDPIKMEIASTRVLSAAARFSIKGLVDAVNASPI